MCERAAAVAARLPGEDAELRAELLGACMMGLAMARYLIGIPTVATADRADIERILRPALDALLGPGAPSAGPGEAGS